MEKIISYITKNLITVIGITILTGTTLTTSALGVIKVANNFDNAKLEVPEVEGIGSTSMSSPTPTSNPTDMTQSSGNSAGSIPRSKVSMNGSVSILPTTSPVSNFSSTQANTTSAGCIISLFGKQYDVTNLRSTHSGGDIFNCGTDMSAVYQGKHGTNLSRMNKYLISAGGTTSSGNTSGNTGGSTSGGTQDNGSSSTSTQTENHEEEEEEERHEEDKRQEETEHHDEDEVEEREAHLESFLRHLLRLVVS